MDSVTQSFRSKCQCVIDCTSLALRCCSPSDQYYHYPNYAVVQLLAPVHWWSQLREICWHLEVSWGGGVCREWRGVLLSPAESSWRSLAAGEGTTRQGPLWHADGNFYNCCQPHLYILLSSYRCCAVSLLHLQLSRVALLPQCFMVRLSVISRL